jgi:hypothetical protein
VYVFCDSQIELLIKFLFKKSTKSSDSLLLQKLVTLFFSLNIRFRFHFFVIKYHIFMRLFANPIKAYFMCKKYVVFCLKLNRKKAIYFLLFKRKLIVSDVSFLFSYLCVFLSLFHKKINFIIYFACSCDRISFIAWGRDYWLG